MSTDLFYDKLRRTCPSNGTYVRMDLQCTEDEWLAIYRALKADQFPGPFPLLFRGREWLAIHGDIPALQQRLETALEPAYQESLRHPRPSLGR
ncbi:MAG: hypothetical protein Greene041619_1238 [Candidatus Peregrinibacteria bacterium Greene0416_19]|nr:MAG: hypothetical protein Greene041619_1238 [Candidatus Peregrinibacteria bacterium Greene0416_19]